MPQPGEILRVRDAKAGDTFRRYRSLDLDDGSNIDGSDPVIRITASTCAPVRTWIQRDADSDPEPWDEILDHAPEAVDAGSAASLLINHDENQLAGGIRSVSFDGATSQVEATIDPEARMRSGVSVRSAVKNKSLRGVSIGYGYRAEDCEFDEEKRSFRVRKWRLLEVSLTPIPADGSAGVRSIPQRKGGPAPGTPTMDKFKEWLKARGLDHDKLNDVQRTAFKADFDAHQAREAAEEEARARAGGETVERERAAILKETKEVAEMVRSVGLDAADFAGLRKADAQAKIIEKLAERDAGRGAKPAAPAAPHIAIGEEAIDKLAKRAVGALMWNAGFRHTNGHAATADLKDSQDSNILRGRGILDIIRLTAEGLGVRTADLDKHALAALALSSQARPWRGRDAANVATGYFGNFVFLNLITKAVAIGYSMGGRSIKYEPLVSRNYVPDYKNFALGTLAVGNLQKTVEDAAFPELTKSEGAYQSNVKMWGGTMSLTEQAIVSDDTGQFMENLRMAGVIAKKTIDKRVFQVLLRGTSTSDSTATWTNNTTASATIVATTNDQVVAARANLAKVRTALMTKTGLDGNPTGNIGSFLVVPASREFDALGLMAVAPGQQNNVNMSYQVIATPWLENSGLTGNSTTSYYMLADPNEATGLVLSTIMGQEDPKVEQYDPGAVAAYKWKVYLPFEVDLFHAANSAGTDTIPAAQQGTT